MTNFLSKLFGRKKEVSTKQTAFFNYLPQAVSFPRDYENYANESYRKNIIAYSAIRMVASNAKTIKFLLYKNATTRNGKRTEILEHPILDLLNRPNAAMNGKFFVEANFSYRSIAGNNFLIGIYPKESGPPSELWPVRPDKMKIVPGNFSLPQAYIMKLGQSKELSFPVDPTTGKSQIMHWRSFNPLNDFYGQSPVDAGAFSIDQHNESGKWNVALLKNAATPSGAFVVEGELSTEQEQYLKFELKRQYEGARNAGKPMVLAGGVKWEQFGFSPRDMDWLQSKNVSARDVARTFGVPPYLLGIPGDNTYANYAEARQALWIETIIPEVDDYLSELNHWLVPQFGQEKLELDYDKDSLDALSVSRNAVWDKITNSTFLTINEKRNAVGYDDHDAPEANEIWIPAGLMPLGLEDLSVDDNADTSDIVPDNDDSEDDSKCGCGKIFVKQELIFDSVDDNYDKQEIKSALAEAWKLFNARDDADRRRIWSSSERLRFAHQRRMARGIKKAFQDEQKLVLNAVKDLTPLEAIKSAEDAIDKNLPNLFEIVRKNELQLMEDFAERVFRIVKNQSRVYQSKQLEDSFKNYLETWIKNVTGLRIQVIGNNSKKQVTKVVRKIMLDSLDDGLNSVEIAKKIDYSLTGLYEGFTKNRAITIARTETVSAANAASKQAAKETNVPLLKEWIASTDERTRNSHVKINGKKIPMDDKFELQNKDGSTVEMDAPGDPNGTAEQVINCRCILGYVREDS